MTYIPRLMCLSCNTAMSIEHTGEVVRVDTADGMPYYIIHTDSYRCPSCGTVAAYASPTTDPAHHHYEKDFSERKFDSIVRLTS